MRRKSWYYAFALFVIVVIFYMVWRLHVSRNGEKQLYMMKTLVKAFNNAYFQYKHSHHQYLTEADFPKIQLKLPLLNDKVQLFAFANKVNKLVFSS